MILRATSLNLFSAFCVCTVPHSGEMELEFWIGLVSIQSTFSLFQLIKE